MPLSTAAFPCCRNHDLFAPVEEYPQRIQRTRGDEAYWFGWDSSFDGKATIRIAKLRDDVMISRVYRASRFGKVRRFRGLLTTVDWSLLEDAIVAANFWMMDERKSWLAELHTASGTVLDEGYLRSVLVTACQNRTPIAGLSISSCDLIGQFRPSRIAPNSDLAIPPHGRLRPHGRRESAAAKRGLRA